jgi:hypothetical protein
MRVKIIDTMNKFDIIIFSRRDSRHRRGKKIYLFKKRERAGG